MWVAFKSERSFNDQRSVFQRSESFLKSDQEAGLAMKDRLGEVLQEVSRIEIRSTDTLYTAGMSSAIRKMELLTNAVTLLPPLQQSLEGAIRRLQVRNSQISQRQGKQLGSSDCSEVRLLCRNSSLSWDEAFSNLLNCQDSNGSSGGPLSVQDLI